MRINRKEIGALLFLAVPVLLAYQNPDLADVALQLWPLVLGFEVIPPAGTLPDFGAVAQQDGLEGFVGGAGIAAVATVTALKITERF